MAVSERTFGVEIECTYGQRPTKKSDVYERINWGERDPMRAQARKDFLAHPELKRWANNIGIDGSGIEIRSPILKGQEGIEELAAVFDFLIEKGSSVTNQDGMHVHHGAGDFASDYTKLYRACATWGHWTPQIHKMVPNRRRNGGMCPDAFNNKEVLKRLEESCLGDAKENAKLMREYQAALNRYYRGSGAWPGQRRIPAHPANIGGRGAFNLGNLNSGRAGKGTIEIRLAEGMMDKDAAIAWVKFGQGFLDACAEGEGKVIEGKPKNVDTLLTIARVDEDAAKVLKAKAERNGHAAEGAAPGKVADGVNYDESEDVE